MKCPSCGEEHPTADMKRFAERFITCLAVVSTFQLKAHDSQNPEVSNRIQRIGMIAFLGINLDSLAQVFQVIAQAKLEELAKAGKDPLEWLQEMSGQLGPHESAEGMLASVLKAKGNTTGMN